MGLFSLLSPYVGSGLAVAGLSKLDPTLKKFFGYGTAAGYGTDQMIDFLRSRMSGEGAANQKSKLEEGSQQGTRRSDEKALKEKQRQVEMVPNLVQKGLSTAAGIGAGLAGAGGIGAVGKALAAPFGGSSQAQPAESAQEAKQASGQAINPLAAFPELDNAAKQEIFGGRPVAETAQLLSSNMKFRKYIAKLEKDSGISFLDILTGLYGNMEGSRGQQAQSAQPASAQGQSSGNPKTAQFMQGLSQLGQQLASLKGK